MKKYKKYIFAVMTFFVSLFLFHPGSLSVKAAGETLVAYGPGNGMTDVPIFAPLDFIFSTSLDSSITDNLSNYFSMSPSVTGASWEYFTEDWGEGTMYRVAYVTPEGLALSTDYTASITLSGLTVSLMSDPNFTIPALDQSGDTYSFTVTTTNDPDAMGGALAPLAFAGYPGEGMRDVSPALSSITLNFDKFFEMDATTFTTSNIYVKDVTSGATVSTAVSPNTGVSNVATVSVSLAASKQYRVYVTRDVKEVNGQSIMGMPAGDGTMGPYQYDFFTSASSANVTSTYMGSNLNMYLSGASITNVPLGFVIFLGFDNPLSPSTVNSTNITLFDSTAAATTTTTVSYNSNDNSVMVAPSTVLVNNHDYVLTITTSVQSITGQAVSESVINFTTTATADTTKPQLFHVDGDNYGLFLDFSEPMNEAKVISKSYYTLKTRASDATAWSSATGVNLSSANLRYSPENYSVMIDGLSLTPGQEFQLTASTSITDLTGNILDDASSVNIKTGIIMDASLFGGGSGMFSGTGDLNMDDMGMMPVNVMPMSNMAGLTTKYFIHFPITSQIPQNGLIEFIFPTGFNVTSVIQDAYSPMNSDFNMEGIGGTVTFASTDPSGYSAGGASNDGLGVSGEKTVVLKLSAATLANDFLAIDLDGIVNSSVPKGYETDGYTVEIRTKDADGALLEVMQSMPFFITGGGTSSLNVTVGGVTSGHNGDIAIFLDSPVTGPIKKTATFTDAVSTVVNFLNIPDGQYMFFTQPIATLGSTDYTGLIMPEPITISGETNKTISLTKEAAGAGKATITVNMTGSFGTDDIDVFAGSPTGFKVKTLVDAGTNPSAQLFLPDGEWMVGMGPAMPKDPMAGPPPMPDWMPPMPTMVKVSGSGTVVKETSGTANDGTIVMDLSSQSVNTISGTVVDGSGTGIANAEVYAYQPNGGFGGAHAKTASDGSFTLKIPVLGVYTIGAFKPGLPDAQEQAIDVQANVTGLTIKIKKPAYTISGKVLNSGGSGIAYAPVWAYQPSGNAHADTMTDSSGNYILYVDNGTWRIETDAPGTGWMEYGSDISVSGASLEGINIRPNADTTYYSISGTVTINSSAQTYMPIRAVAYDANGNHLGRSYDTMTDSSGNYTISAPAGIYRVDIWTPEYGEVERTDADDYSNHPANVNLSSGNKTGVDITIANASLKTITIIATNGTAAYEGFVHIEGVDMTDPNNPKPTNYHRSLYISDLSQNETISLEDNKHYFFFLDVPGLGHFTPIAGTDAADGAGGTHPTTGDIVINGVDRNVTFLIPDTTDNSNYVTVSGTVTAGGSNLEDAWVWVGNPQTGFHNGTNTNASGAYSLTLPVLSSGSYMIGADKPGYVSPEPTELDLTDANSDGDADNAKNFTLTAHTSSISGYIYTDTNSDGDRDSGEEISNGWVYAEEIDTGIMSHSPVDGAGYYSLGVSSGTWRVFGAADGYLDTQYKVSGVNTVITVSGNVTGKDLALSADSNWTNRSKNKPITPANGGVIDDTSSTGTGVKITVPANALGSSNSSGSMNVAETSSVTKTNSATPFGGKGKNITATDNSGQPITNLNDYIDIEMLILKSEIDTEVSEGRLVDYNKLKAMQVGYFDSSVNDWITLSTTRTAYYKTNSSDVEWKTYQGTASATGFAKFIDDALINETFTAFEDYKLVFKSSTNHLTIFGVTVPTESTPPSAPSGLAQSSGSGSSVVLDWDDNSESDLLEYEIYRSASSGVSKASTQVNTSQVTSSTFTDSSVSSWTSYYYTVTAADDSGNESVIATEVRVCSNSTVTNGTVASNCSITCNSGYTQSGNSCVAQSSGGGGGGSITVYCQSVDYDDWQDECVGSKRYRNIKSRFPTNCVLTTEQNASKEMNCNTGEEDNVPEVEHFDIESNDQKTEEVKSKKENEFVSQLHSIIDEAKEVFRANIQSFLSQFSHNRDVDKETYSRARYISQIAKNMSVGASIQDAMVNFVTYGTPTTKKLGEGERAGVINSYKSALGKVPETEAEWGDVIKIANGRWPSETSAKTEFNAEAAFKKIYLRMPDRKNPHDDAAVVIIAYGLRPAQRNLNSEKQAIKTFKHIYGYNPVSASAWDIVRAIAYSGATR